MSTPEKRAVSGSFIFRFPNDDVLATPQVALFLRSDKVNAYK
jgi:hypothetical protein